MRLGLQIVLAVATVIMIGRPIAASARIANVPSILDAPYAAEPLEIGSGADYVAWSVQRTDPSQGCTASAQIRRDDTEQPMVILYEVSLAGAGDEIESGRKSLDGITAGQYLVDFGGDGCLWTMVVFYGE